MVFDCALLNGTMVLTTVRFPLWCGIYITCKFHGNGFLLLYHRCCFMPPHSTWNMQVIPYIPISDWKCNVDGIVIPELCYSYVWLPSNRISYRMTCGLTGLLLPRWCPISCAVWLQHHLVAPWCNTCCGTQPWWATCIWWHNARGTEG